MKRSTLWHSPGGMCRPGPALGGTGLLSLTSPVRHSTRQTCSFPLFLSPPFRRIAPLEERSSHLSHVNENRKMIGFCKDRGSLEAMVSNSHGRRVMSSSLSAAEDLMCKAV
ncbi:hypothetical protein TNCV_3142771 [Trichonephila clavipes]|nr:hypothetical protein TNCV_3142771 [Trichonephila clavipes]